MSELLPRPVRLLLGATSRGVGERRLRGAVAGKVVLITGASSGVGEAAAMRLGAAGATVLLVARRAELLDEVCAEITAAGGKAFAYPCDLSDGEAVDALADDVLTDHGHVDVLVSNAGMSIRRWISESYDRFRDIERTINVNYLGPVRLILALLPSMRVRGAGQIVSVATIGVGFAPMRWSAYIASKAALETWLAGVGPEVRADGVSVTSIHLQLVRSPMLGPFRMWSYLPGMSSEEAGGIIARAIVERPRTIAPAWARAGAAVSDLAQAPIELALAQYARRINPDSRRRGAAAPLRGLPAAVGGLSAIAQTGVIRPVRPDRLVRALAAQRRFGATPAAAAAAAAELYGSRCAVIDDDGSLSFRELDEQARALAGALHHELGLGEDDRIGVLARNHRGFVQAAVAATRLGCDLVPLNSDFSGPQLADVLSREGVTAVIHDEEFATLLEHADPDVARVLAWHEGVPGAATVQALIAAGAGLSAPLPSAPGRIVTLTSGTTGTPKGATRSVNALALAPTALAGLLDLARIRPVPRSGQPIVVAPPLFHLFGFAAMLAGLAYGSPIVITRCFDPEGTLALIESSRAEVLLAVPTMLRRIMRVAPERGDTYDTGSLRMIISGAAPLAPELAGAVMDRFGDILYNGYASTEVGSGTLATPADLRAAPGTVGRPFGGARVRILGEDGGPLPDGETGRIFVGSPLLFDGYTGGGGKEVIGGLMSTGDVGHVDTAGRLFIDGRDDEMIVSGGENVFPQEVEDLLTAHDGVADAAVFGVPDDEFGQRLAAYVVREDGSDVGEQELRAFVRERLARYKVPREISVVDELPRTATGKLQRRRLEGTAPAE